MTITSSLSSLARRQNRYPSSGYTAVCALTIAIVLQPLWGISYLPEAWATDGTISIKAGFNLVGMPVAVSSDLSCQDLQQEVGTNDVHRLNRTTQQFESCSVSPFPLQAGEGYVVESDTPGNFQLSGNLSCPELDLPAGRHLIAVPTPPEDFSCFSMLQVLGDRNTIASIQRYNPATGAFATCGYDPVAAESVPVGIDFPIQAGEGYLVALQQAVSAVQLNDTERCNPNQPPLLSSIGDQTVIQGTSLTFAVSASDPDGDPVTLSVAPDPLPRNAVFDPSTGVFTFRPDVNQVGVFSLTFTASDGIEATTETIKITVQSGAGATALSAVILITVYFDDSGSVGVGRTPVGQ